MRITQKEPIDPEVEHFLDFFQIPWYIKAIWKAFVLIGTVTILIFILWNFLLGPVIYSIIPGQYPLSIEFWNCVKVATSIWVITIIYKIIKSYL